MRYRTARGSNQYSTRIIIPKRKFNWHYFIYLGIFMLLVATGRQIYLQKNVYAQGIDPRLILPFTPDLAGKSAELNRDENIRPLNPEELKNWEDMKKMAYELAPLYDYNPSVLIAQMALESAYGTSTYCIERNNCFGINAVDSNPDLAFWYENKAQGMIENMRLIRTYYPEAYAVRDDTDRMIDEIKEGGYATDPYYAAKLKAIAQKEK